MRAGAALPPSLPRPSLTDPNKSAGPTYTDDGIPIHRSRNLRQIFRGDNTFLDLGIVKKKRFF